METVEFTATVLGYHPEYGELVAASAAIEVIKIFSERCEQLRAENEALRKSIPKIKADAVREAVYELKKAYGLNTSRLYTYDLLDYADKLQSQAAKGGE